MSPRLRFPRIARIAVAAIATMSLTMAVRAHAYEAETVKDGGRIAGTVKFDGAPPPRKPIDISKDREVCGAVPHYDESLVVSAGGGIANAVVSIPAIAKGAALVPLKDVKVRPEELLLHSARARVSGRQHRRYRQLRRHPAQRPH